MSREILILCNLGYRNKHFPWWYVTLLKKKILFNELSNAGSRHSQSPRVGLLEVPVTCRAVGRSLQSHHKPVHPSYQSQLRVSSLCGGGWCRTSSEHQALLFLMKWVMGLRVIFKKGQEVTILQPLWVAWAQGMSVEDIWHCIILAVVYYSWSWRNSVAIRDSRGEQSAQDWCCLGLQGDAAPQCPASQAALLPSLNSQTLPTLVGTDLLSRSGCPGAWWWLSPGNCQLQWHPSEFS